MWPGYFLQKQNMHQFTEVLFNDCVLKVLVSFSEYRLDNII